MTTPRSGKTTCNCGACEIDPGYWPDAPTEAARQCAWGANGGGWCCDCIDWTHEDGMAALSRRIEEEMRNRDRAREALRLVVLRLTAADGESVACGAGAALGARAIAREGLKP